jgi:hypothetical protein
MSLPTLSPEGGDILFQNRPTTIRFALSGKTRALTVHWDGVVHLTLPDCLRTRFHGKMATSFLRTDSCPMEERFAPEKSTMGQNLELQRHSCAPE